ncbi:MAG: glycosyltransferase [Acetobacterales bacterium]
MRISLYEDSIPYDSEVARSRPLGGVAKAVVGLAEELARAGHDVSVFNRLRHARVSEGVAWRPLDGDEEAAGADLAIAVGRSALLDRTEAASRRALWVTGSAGHLSRRMVRERLERWRPVLAFLGDVQMRQWSREPDLPACCIRPGVAAPYLYDVPIVPMAPAQAIATAHPTGGLLGLVGLWRERIRPNLEHARLTIYSAQLAAGAEGGRVTDEVAPVLAAAMEARDSDVVIAAPKPDEDMAFAYRDCRVHLHPAAGRSAFPFTLLESQACGLPAVARRGSAADDAVVDGVTGYLAPDDEAFANLAVLLLDDDKAFEALSVRAREHGRVRRWSEAVRAVEALAP